MNKILLIVITNAVLLVAGIEKHDFNEAMNGEFKA